MAILPAPRAEIGRSFPAALGRVADAIDFALARVRAPENPQF